MCCQTPNPKQTLNSKVVAMLAAADAPPRTVDVDSDLVPQQTLAQTLDQSPN